MAGHASEVWEKEQLSVKAILCGVCNHEMAISEYLSSENTCPNCKAAFNPACSNDYHLYFEA